MNELEPINNDAINPAEEEGEAQTSLYDTLSEISDEGLPHALKLFVMAGRMGGGVGGYFFEQPSMDLIHSLHEIPVYDTEGNELGKLWDYMAAYRAFKLAEDLPSWLVIGKQYQIGKPMASDKDIEALWKLRDQIQDRLGNKGAKAAEEFLLIGTLMGSEEMDEDEIKAVYEKLGLSDKTDLLNELLKSF